MVAFDSLDVRLAMQYIERELDRDGSLGRIPYSMGQFEFNVIMEAMRRVCERRDVDAVLNLCSIGSYIQFTPREQAS